jgi:hypothetical protein
MNKRIGLLFPSLLGIALLWAFEPVWAGYKARPWCIGARDSYPARITSEGVTIAVEPLFTDALAARVFDKKDIVTRGIMPLAILIFNENSFPIAVDALSIELIHEGDHIRTLYSNEVVSRLFGKDKFWISRQVSPMSGKGLNKNAMDDFEGKFLVDKAIAPHDKGGGFLYMQIHSPGDLARYLSKSILYIPKVYRQDNGSRLIFFEIELAAAVNPGKRE